MIKGASLFPVHDVRFLLCLRKTSAIRFFCVVQATFNCYNVNNVSVSNSKTKQASGKKIRAIAKTFFVLVRTFSRRKIGDK